MLEQTAGKTYRVVSKEKKSYFVHNVTSVRIDTNAIPSNGTDATWLLVFERVGLPTTQFLYDNIMSYEEVPARAGAR